MPSLLVAFYFRIGAPVRASRCALDSESISPCTPLAPLKLRLRQALKPFIAQHSGFSGP